MPRGNPLEKLLVAMVRCVYLLERIGVYIRQTDREIDRQLASQRDREI